jgi:hypothetical protein
MALRSGHGKGAGVPRLEVLPADELPNGVQVDVQDASTSERKANGTWTKGARTDQAKGGHSRAGVTRLARRMGLAGIDSDPTFAPYRRAAADFRRTHVTGLARSVGGGFCGPAPASIIASAAWQLAASRFLFDTAHGDVDKLTAASKLANDSRQNLLAAHELCAREATARRDSEGSDLDQRRRDFQRQLAAKNGAGA